MGHRRRPGVRATSKRARPGRSYWLAAGPPADGHSARLVGLRVDQPGLQESLADDAVQHVQAPPPGAPEWRGVDECAHSDWQPNEELREEVSHYRAQGERDGARQVLAAGPLDDRAATAAAGR